MAVYIPLSRRRRNAGIVVTAALVLGVTSGWAIGHAQAPSVASQVRSVQSRGGDLASRIGALPIEYEQALAGQIDSIQAGVLDALDGIRTEVLTTFDRAPWLQQSERDTVTNALAAVRTAATARAPLADFVAACTTAAGALDDVLGITRPGA